jgi:hypothetical protein
MAGLKDTIIMAGYHASRQFMLDNQADVLYDTITWRASNLADDVSGEVCNKRRILGVSYERQVWGQ